MKNKLKIILIFGLFSCQQDNSTPDETTKPAPFKIIIEDDAACTGTRSQFILTNKSFEHSYLKNGVIPNDTLIQHDNHLVPNARLIEISRHKVSQLEKSNSKKASNLNFTFIKNNESKTVQIDESNPDEFICEVISFINELSVKKYQLDCGCEK